MQVIKVQFYDFGSSVAMKNFSGFLKLPFEIFAIAAPRSDFSCC